MSTFQLPDLGEGLTEAEIVSWHVAAGDHVVADQPLVSVETAKAVVEIPSPQSGLIETLFGEPGDIVAIGSTLVVFEEDGVAGSDAIVGELPQTKSAQPPTRVVPKRPQQALVQASPATRKLARELDVELAKVNGSGPGGTITAEDVRAFAAAAVGFSDGIPLRGPRRAMAQLMTKAGREVVPATVTDVANIDTWDQSDDPTVRLIEAVGAACAVVPRLNAWFNGASSTLLIHDKVDLGIAVDTADGLFVPVLKDVQKQTPDDLRMQLDELKQGVNKRSLAPADLTGQTITLSNFGMMAGLHASLVVAPPQVAILGAGRIEERVVVRNHKPVVAHVLPLSLSFDHRAVTGGDATAFLAAVIASLQADRKKQSKK